MLKVGLINVRREGMQSSFTIITKIVQIKTNVYLDHSIHPHPANNLKAIFS